MDFSEIPVINIREVLSTGSWDAQLDTLREACTDVGFFYLAGHAFDNGLISELVNCAGEFFALEAEEKMRVQINRHIRGYLPLASELTDLTGLPATRLQKTFTRWAGLSPRSPSPSRTLCWRACY